MAQFPNNVPTGFAGDYTDFLKTKADKSGALRIQYKSVTIDSDATSGFVSGLIPFNKGFRLSYGSKLHVTDMDTKATANVTLNIGYQYSDTSLTSDLDAFASAITTGQTGGLVTFDEEEGLSWVAEGDGWITVSVAAGAVTNEGTAKGQLEGAYDGQDASN